MAVFRVEKNANYTTMSNYHLRDKQLSLKAKGLLSFCLSLPDTWDYSIMGLAAVCKEGRDCIMSTLQELEELGYLRRERTRNADGTLAGADYVIYELPQPVSENPDTDEPIQENPTQDKPTLVKGDGKAGDEFWTKAETLLYCALIGYIHYEAPKEEQNFATLIEFLNAMEVREDDETFQNPVDLMFEALKKKEPNHFAVRQYAKYKLAAGKTAKSVLISCGARLAPFDIQEVRDITMYDELSLDTIGDKKTALFLIMSDTDPTFNFLISMIYTQLFNLLCEKADDVYGGRLPVHVRCLIDECANIGQIPNLEKLVATIRSREISACLVLQAQSQLKAIYKDNADTIVGNMDSRIFLGGAEPTTLKELNAALGKETIDTYNTSDTRGNSPSYGTNYSKLGKDLATVDELAVLDGGKCILQLRGVRPFLSEKYDLTKHPNYRLTAGYDKKNTFDIEAFLSHRLKLKPNDEYTVIDADNC